MHDIQLNNLYMYLPLLMIPAGFCLYVLHIILTQEDLVRTALSMMGEQMEDEADPVKYMLIVLCIIFCFIAFVFNLWQLYIYQHLQMS